MNNITNYNTCCSGGAVDVHNDCKCFQTKAGGGYENFPQGHQSEHDTV